MEAVTEAVTEVISGPAVQVAKTMSWLDMWTFAIMLGVSTLIGVYFAYCAPKSTGNVEADYLVGGRTMNTLPVALSLFASFISAIAMLGYPAEVYVHGGQVIYNAISYPLTGYFMASQMLPVFRRLKGLSLYEYLDLRFSKKCRFLSSCLFLVSNIVWLPVVLYVASLAFEQVTKVDVAVVGPVACIICIYYTAVGGVKAVIWTDAFQAVAMLGCMVIVVCRGVSEVGGFGVVWERNLNSTRLEAPLVDFDPTTRHTIFTLLIGGVIRHTADLALSQSIIQRYMALPSLRHCYNATAIFMVCTVAINVFSCTNGFVAAAYYHDCDPITSGAARTKDQIIPMFVMDILSDTPGLTGLFIAGVFSAAMSSLSTGLNSISAVVLEDWLRGLSGWTPSPRQTSWLLRGIVVVAGLVNLALMFAVEHLGMMILQLNVALSAMACAPQFTLFAAGLFLPFVNTKGALLGAFCSAALTGFLVIGAQVNAASNMLSYAQKPVSIDGCLDLPEDFNVTLPHLIPHDNSDVFWLFRLSYLWYQPLAISTGLLVASLAALAGWRNDSKDVDPSLLAPLTRWFVHGKEHKEEESPAQLALLHDLRQSMKESERRGSN